MASSIGHVHPPAPADLHKHLYYEHGQAQGQALYGIDQRHAIVLHRNLHKAVVPSPKVTHSHNELSPLQLFDHLSRTHGQLPHPLSETARNGQQHLKLHQAPSVPRTSRTGKWLVRLGLTLLVVGGSLFGLLFLLALANALWGWA